MSHKSRDCFIVIEKPTLNKWLKTTGKGPEDYFLPPVVLSSSALEHDLQPGAMSFIQEDLKKYFIQCHLQVALFGYANLQKLFGHYSSETELFDRFWELKEALNYEVPIDLG